MTTLITTPSKETFLTVLEANRPSIEQMIMAFMPLDATPLEAQYRLTREIAAVEQWIRMKPELNIEDKSSIVYAVRQCIQDGLTLAPSANLAYLIPARVKTGQNGSNDVYEWVISYEPTGDGMLSMARQAGRIYDHKRPVCEYDDSGMVTSVSIEFLVPSYGSPRWELVVFGPGHFKKWRKASHDKNARGKSDADPVTMNYANANYTSFNGGIDPEFAGTKAIVHGLAKRGTNKDEIQRTISGNKNPEPVQQFHSQETRYTITSEANIEPLNKAEDAPYVDISNERDKIVKHSEGALIVINPNDM